MNLEELTNQIYSAIYGDIDSKSHRSQKKQEFFDWLTDGDLSDKPSLETLIAEWQEYDQEAEDDAE